MAADFPDPSRREYVTSAIESVNNKVKVLAAVRGLPVVDAYEMYNLYLTAEPLVVGGVNIIKAVPPSPDSEYFLLPDRVHPGTVWQGLFANAFLEAFNRAYSTNFTHLSDQEILAAAGIPDPSPGDEPTFFNIMPFVIDPVEPAFPDFMRDGIVDLRDFARLASYWGLSEPHIDIAPAPYGDGIVDYRDLAVLSTNWLK